MAWRNSSKVKALEAQYQASKTISNQVDNYPDPEVSLGLGILPVETRLGPQRLRLGASQMIPWPGLLKAKAAMAEAMAEVKSVDAANYMIEVTYQIKKAYYLLYGLEQKQELYEDQIQYLETLKDLVTTRIEAGDAKLSDVFKIESKIIEMEGMKEQIQIAESSPNYIINRFTLQPISATVQFDQDFEMFFSENLTNTSISMNHPQLLKYDRMKEVSLQAIELTEYQSKPKIGVGLDYIMVGQRDDAFPDGNGRDIVMPMGKISIPLNKASYQNKRQEEQLKMEALDHLKEDFNEEGNKEINLALNSMRQANNAYKWNNDIIENNRSTIELITTAYTSSEVSIEELLNLYMDNIRREMAKIDAIVQSHLAKAQIEKFQTITSF